MGRIVVLVGGLCLASWAGATALTPVAAPPVVPKIFEEVSVDPLAAAREGLWDVARPVSAKKLVAFEAMRADPLAAERCGLWQIDVAAGCGKTKCCALPKK
jgi:hypothetical protein